MSEDIRALKFHGGVDADGHILEDKSLWENYLEARYKPKAIRLKKDRTGLEYMEIEGRPSKFLSGGMFAGLSAMGNTREMERNSADYGGMAPFGAMDPTERLKRIETENLDAAFLYPTLSLLYEVETTDPEMAQAYTRAYNRYIVDFCKVSGGKLLPVAHLSLGDAQAAAKELERAVKDGCKGGWVCQFVMTRKPHAHPDHDVELVGADKFFWASDFPHPDHAGNYIEEVEEMAEKLSPDARRKVLGDNVMKVHGCTT